MEHVSDLLSSFSFSPARALEIDRREVGRSRADKLVEFCGDGCAVSIASSERRNTISGALKQRKGRPRGPNHIHPGLYASKNSYKKMKDPGCDARGLRPGQDAVAVRVGLSRSGLQRCAVRFVPKRGHAAVPLHPRLMSPWKLRDERRLCWEQSAAARLFEAVAFEPGKRIDRRDFEQKRT